MLSAAPYHEHFTLLGSRQLLELHAGHGLAGHILRLTEDTNASADGLRGQLVVACDHYHLQTDAPAERHSASQTLCAPHNRKLGRPLMCKMPNLLCHAHAAGRKLLGQHNLEGRSAIVTAAREKAGSKELR